MKVVVQTAAFNSGSDARIRGESLYSCPMDDQSMRLAWESGWRHCDHNYGVENKRYIIQPLPSAEGSFALRWR
jgi:ribosome modulation factor